MNHKVMVKALNVIKDSVIDTDFPLTNKLADAIYAIEAELAKPEQEPQMIRMENGKFSYIKKPWVGLTDDEVYEIANFCKDQPFNLYAKEIENKLRSKNAV